MIDVKRGGNWNHIKCSIKTTKGRKRGKDFKNKASATNKRLYKYSI